MSDRTIALCFLAFALNMSTAAAQQTERLREKQFHEHAILAETSYNRANFENAVSHLHAAYTIEPVPQVLFNLGQAYRRLERFSDARVHYELYRSTVPNIPKNVRASLDQQIADMRLAEKEGKSPKVVEKTRLLVLRSVNPPPRWMLPVGITTGLLGLGGLGAGIGVLALNGQCTSPPVPPAMQCGSVYDTKLPGAVMAVAGGGLAVLGLTLTGLSLRRPPKPVLTETDNEASADTLLSLADVQIPESRDVGCATPKN